MLPHERDNIFQRTCKDLKTQPHKDLPSQMSEVRLIFEACVLTIKTLADLLSSQPEDSFQQADLQDYSFALVDIKQFIRKSSNDDVGTQYPFSKLMDPLNEAAQYLIEAKGETNVFISERTKNIQMFVACLDKTLEQIKGLGDPPP